MQRGIGGRIENAFEAAKERGEAAFVTFVTAGYPRAQGKQNPFTEHESG
jgi:tryptophan synthase